MSQSQITAAAYATLGFAEDRPLTRGRGAAGHQGWSVAPDGQVREWDEVAGHFTMFHSLTEARQGEIRALAAVTDEQIRSLRADLAESEAPHGATPQDLQDRRRLAVLCSAALAGDEQARLTCAETITAILLR